MIDYFRSKRIKKPESEEINEICSKTWKDVYGFIYYKVQNKEEAEDITQEAYKKALPYLRKGETDPDKYGSLLKTIALNILRDNWRRSKRQGVQVSLESIYSEEMGRSDFADEVIRRNWIAEALQKLGSEHKTVIKLRILKGYSVAETAKAMRKSEGNIRIMQYRALLKLNEIMKSDSKNGKGE